MTWRNSRNKINYNLFHIAIIIGFLFVFSACSQGDKRTKNDLPFIGQHDIVYEATSEHEIGDTIFHTVPDWEYINEDSVHFGSSQINNKIWIANFFFSYCPTICKPMNLEMFEINKLLENEKKNIQFLSFSIDEKRDTPSRLRRYKELLEITSENWTFLTGSQAEIHDLAIHGFQVLAEEDETAPGGFIHSSNLILVDQNRHIRGIYDSSNPKERDRIVADVKLLLE